VLGALISLAVFLDSPGPVFYRSPRIGYRGRGFEMLKFRKMRNAAAGAPVTNFADTRLTPIGRFLQATRLDELPQFLHVLRGEMSLVGPRPEVPEFVDLYRDEYEEILSVLPGLTGLVQVQFIEESRLLAAAVRYEDIMPAKVELDLHYVRRRTLAMDGVILARTLVLPLTVAFGRSLGFVRRQAAPHLAGWALATVGGIALLVAFAAQAGPIR
jgi:lipopolysaccharide/colanic/teichoic acid biosynthesis glycosyltransferase